MRLDRDDQTESQRRINQVRNALDTNQILSSFLTSLPQHSSTPITPSEQSRTAPLCIPYSRAAGELNSLTGAFWDCCSGQQYKLTWVEAITTTFTEHGQLAVVKICRSNSIGRPTHYSITIPFRHSHHSMGSTSPPSPPVGSSNGVLMIDDEW